MRREGRGKGQEFEGVHVFQCNVHTTYMHVHNIHISSFPASSIFLLRTTREGFFMSCSGEGFERLYKCVITSNNSLSIALSSSR